jgi:hypothetical protein
MKKGAAMIWKFHHPQMTLDHLGWVPTFLSEDDPRPARVQIHENYSHGGGWAPLPKWELLPDNSIKYPGDDALFRWPKPVCGMKLFVFIHTLGLPPSSLMVRSKLRD